MLSFCLNLRGFLGGGQFFQKAGVAFLILYDIINRTFGSISILNSFKIEATYDNRSDN